MSSEAAATGLDGLFERLAAMPMSEGILGSAWLFPAIETVHVLAICIVVGMILRLDLRLLGWTGRERPVRELAQETLAWTWVAFVVAAISGGLLFVSDAVRYAGLTPFRIKFALMALAGVNMLLFHIGAYRRVDLWGAGGATPTQAARVAGALSAVLWVSIVFAGRWIGFV